MTRNKAQQFTTLFQVTERLAFKGLQRFPQLEHAMQPIFEANPDAPADFIAKYLLKQVLDTTQTGHLSGCLCTYLDDLCLRVGRQVSKLPLQHPPLDCFLTARLVAADHKALFKGYDFCSSGLKTYARPGMKTKTLEYLQVSKEVTGYSNWGRLKYLGKDNFEAALQAVNFSQSSIARCLLALYCFKKVYSPGDRTESKQLPPPDDTQWWSMVRMFNELCPRQDLPPVSRPQEVKKLLAECLDAQATRVKMRSPVAFDENILTELEGDMAESDSDLPGELGREVSSILCQTLLRFPPDRQILLPLFYGLHLTQRTLGHIFDVDQGTISRRLKDCQKELLLAVRDWSLQHHSIALTQQQLSEAESHIHDWLTEKFQSLYHDFFQSTLLAELPDRMDLLRLHYGKQLKLAAVARELNLSPKAAQQQLTEVRQHLLTCLKRQVQDKFELSFPSSADKRLQAFVENWLQSAPYGAFYQN